MPDLWPAFSSNRRISSMSRRALSSASLPRSGTASPEEPPLPPSGTVRGTSAIWLLSWANAIDVLRRVRGGPSHILNPAAAEARGARPSTMPDQHRDVARIGIVEKLPGPLVEHVGVDAVGLQERDAALPARAFGLGGIQLAH